MLDRTRAACADAEVPRFEDGFLRKNLCGSIEHHLGDLQLRYNAQCAMSELTSIDRCNTTVQENNHHETGQPHAMPCWCLALYVGLNSPCIIESSRQKGISMRSWIVSALVTSSW